MCVRRGPAPEPQHEVGRRPQLLGGEEAVPDDLTQGPGHHQGHEADLDVHAAGGEERDALLDDGGHSHADAPQDPDAGGHLHARDHHRRAHQADHAVDHLSDAWEETWLNTRTRGRGAREWGPGRGIALTSMIAAVCAIFRGISTAWSEGGAGSGGGISEWTPGDGGRNDESRRGAAEVGAEGEFVCLSSAVSSPPTRRLCRP